MQKKLTLSLPIEVWDRLNAEAKRSGKTIGTYTKDLIVARDERKNK